MHNPLDFEKPVTELESKIEELRHLSSSTDVNIAEEITRLQKKSSKLLHSLYSSLTPWQTVQVARHPNRPHFFDYVRALIDDFTPLAGDRLFGEDAAIIGGLGRFKGQSVVVLGQEKGNDTESRLKHGFGMPRPEGYRKAQRLMKLANHYRLPLITLVDTAGASPVTEAEERGQAEAIARCIDVSLELEIPIITLIIGEGGSGGAIAIATANKVFMLQNSIYSVISPEGCASILWRSRDKREEAAAALKLKANDLLKLGVIDGIIPEPLGGAHRNPSEVFDSVSQTLEETLHELLRYSPSVLKKMRQEKYIEIGSISL
ncbi:MAG: acetyl-CoA carboxylase carboxyltransferase subunit alpha [Proteobacteria bacterium]|nr:acetyl-CoA carboxylase carboxyltransferase subunit alpha [Pseudomonadota bacterium]